MFLPFIIYSVIKQDKKINALILVVNSFALLLLGTRVSVLGTIIVYTYTVCGILLFSKIIHKEKIEEKIKWGRMILVSTVLLIYIFLLPFNPMFKRIYEMENLNEYVTYEGIEANIVIADVEFNLDIFEYIESNFRQLQIHEQFILYRYPYQYDPEFWLEIMEQDVSQRTNYRHIQRQMIRRVVEINDNRLDSWFGITNTRLQNIFNIEQDFIVHYYALRSNWFDNNSFPIRGITCVFCV